MIRHNFKFPLNHSTFNTLEELTQQFYKLSQALELPPQGFSVGGSSPTSQIAYDLEQVIRYYVAWTEHPEGGFTVDFNEPLKYGPEPLASMEKKP